MSVDAKHPEYTEMATRWETCRDTADGEQSVKAKDLTGEGGRYIPVPKGMRDDKEDYRDYVRRGNLFNATGRTIDGLTGMVFRKRPTFEFDASLEPLMNDATLGGVDMTAFAEQLVEEVLTTGRFGIISDYPRVDGAQRTQAEAEEQNLRPFLKYYRAEDIIDWQLAVVNNVSVLSQVRLAEQVEEAKDEFESKTTLQIRVLDLNPDDSGNISTPQYRQRIYQPKSATSGTTKPVEWEQVGGDIFPLANGQTIDFIPFTFGSAFDTTPQVRKPPLLDLVNVNQGHYRNSANYEHALHYLGLPTPYVFGTQEPMKTVGPTHIWHSPDTDVTVGLLEFSGDGLPGFENAMAAKEQQMAVLGARMLFPEKKAVESVETAAMHRQGENSALASLAIAVGQALEQAIGYASVWLADEPNIEVRLNQDYLPAGMTPQMLMALIQAVQTGQISRRTFFDNLQRGEIVGDDADFDEQESQIQTEAPPDMGEFMPEAVNDA